MKLPSRRESLRRAARSLLSAQHWKARLVLWSAGAAVGGIAVAFAWLADTAHTPLHRLLQDSLWWPWVLAPPGFALIAWLTQRFFRGAEGSGIPQTIYALRPQAGPNAEQLLRPHVAAGRTLLAALGLLCGGSIGREGPTVHVGTVLGHAFGRFMPHWHSGTC